MTRLANAPLMGAALACALATPAAAQAPGSQAPAHGEVGTAASPVGTLRVGGAIGLNSARLGGADGELMFPRSKLGAAFGAAINYTVSDTVALQPELLYSMKGGRFDFSEFGGGEGSVSIDYLQVPLLVQARIPLAGKVTPVLNVGPSVNILLRSVSETNGETQSARDETSAVDVGLVIGGGLEFETPRGSLVFGIRYEIGLIGVADTEMQNEPDASTRVTTVSVGFLF